MLTFSFLSNQVLHLSMKPPSGHLVSKLVKMALSFNITIQIIDGVFWYIHVVIIINHLALAVCVLCVMRAYPVVYTMKARTTGIICDSKRPNI